ncbi:DUF3086 domain-containing protein [Thermoleptolyngbya sp. C42_A2020_037]|uniref:DUF3086 domain-containing protein n=1 Tax=Thermoleptolyngbya sp. C42_A2020_037 TaxID=2747799 RepID=UPI0025CD5206|nr:DUF3086 domain-containing protein [Thermoleptolyngbya sp. C42_A2020_037]
MNPDESNEDFFDSDEEKPSQSADANFTPSSSEMPDGAVAPLSLAAPTPQPGNDESSVGAIASSDETSHSEFSPEGASDPAPLDLSEGETGDWIAASQPSAEPTAAQADGSMDSDNDSPAAIAARVAALRAQEQDLKRAIAQLQADFAATERMLGRLARESLGELEQRKQALQVSVEQLERRQERIRAEMRSTFAGSSQDIAIRIQGFKDYLVGSLQDLVTLADDLKLSAPQPRERERDREREKEREEPAPKPKFGEPAFQEETRQIRKLLEQYRTSPDYYGPAWQLRRTFEPVHAERVANWFFTQGGRGATRTMGSRLQNILVASAIISILRKLYGPKVRTLILADTPERLGEWRRGLQDCLGISRADFGADQGVVLFEAPEPLAQRADRLLKQKQLPLIIMDESEDVVNLSLLQFPLWIAFASDPTRPMVY